MGKKVGGSHSVAYVAGASAEDNGVEEGFYIVECDPVEDHNGVKHESVNVNFSTRVYPSADGDGWTYTEDDEEGGEE